MGTGLACHDGNTWNELQENILVIAARSKKSNSRIKSILEIAGENMSDGT